MCLLATDNEAMAETVSASSASRRRASLNEQPSVEAERWRERQYLPTKDQHRVKVELEQLLCTVGHWVLSAERFDW